MYIQKIIRKNIENALNEVFRYKTKNIELQQTKKEFDGDITLVVFPLVKELKMNPKEIAEKVGDYLIETNSVVSFNVVSGFLNLSISDKYYLDFFNSIKYNSTKSPLLFMFKIPSRHIINAWVLYERWSFRSR